MYFEEFAIAKGINQDTFDYLEDCCNNKRKVDEYVHNMMMDLFRQYIVVGGMPQVVKDYVKNNNVKRVINLQKSILSLYRQDIIKYADKLKIKITSVFDNIPSQLDKKK